MGLLGKVAKHIKFHLEVLFFNELIPTQHFLKVAQLSVVTSDWC